jgi:hypothetical protein
MVLLQIHSGGIHQGYAQQSKIIRPVKRLQVLYRVLIDLARTAEDPKH